MDELEHYEGLALELLRAKWKCHQDGREFKVLLIMNNCPAHAHYLSDLHPNVQVFFFTAPDDFHHSAS